MTRAPLRLALSLLLLVPVTALAQLQGSGGAKPRLPGLPGGAPAQARTRVATEDTSVHSPECLQWAVWYTDSIAPWGDLPLLDFHTQAPIDVALVDGAADRVHPGLWMHWTGGDDLVDHDGDPYLPYDALFSQDRFLPAFSHATAMASLLAQAGPNVRIHLYRVLGDGCSGEDTVMAEGIARAAADGAKVILIAAGSHASPSGVRKAIDDATALDALVVVAAGNNAGPRCDFPAGARNALTVAALDDDDQAADFTSYGPAVDLSDRGVSVRAAAPGWAEARFSGSSVAAARTAAAATVLRGERPELSVSEIRMLLESTAAPVDEESGTVEKKLGAGRTDVGAAVLALPPQP